MGGMRVRVRRMTCCVLVDRELAYSGDGGNVGRCIEMSVVVRLCGHRVLVTSARLAGKAEVAAEFVLNQIYVTCQIAT